MATRPLRLRQNDSVVKCPKCSNNTSFVARSEQVAEDCCDVWITCGCGYDPTMEAWGHRVEDVWGNLDNDTVNMAFSASWNDAIKDILSKQTATA